MEPVLLKGIDLTKFPGCVKLMRILPEGTGYEAARGWSLRWVLRLDLGPNRATGNPGGMQTFGIFEKIETKEG